MNLVIDVGNSYIKLAVFRENALLQKTSCDRTDFLDRAKEIIHAFPELSHCLLSSVANLNPGFIPFLRQKMEVTILTHETKVPFQNKYETPQTLGVDRIALASAAAMKYPSQNVLIIDAGTCITYDFLSSENEYLGGAISPGLELRYKSLHEFTARLPLLSPENHEVLIGNQTSASIHSGVLNGAAFEIDGFCAGYGSRYQGLTIILTGGDTHFLRDRLKSNIFANSNFLLEGLNFILEYNKH